MVESRNTTLDFVRRTLKNLETIEDLHKEHNGEDKYFEVTQLINSLLGLVIFPLEKDKKLLPDRKLKDLDLTHKPYFYYSKEHPQDISLMFFLTQLRNALAHNNLYFRNERNIIEGVYFWSNKTTYKCDQSTGESKPSEEFLELVVYLDMSCIKELILEISSMYKNHLKSNDRSAQNFQLKSLNKKLCKQTGIDFGLEKNP